MANPCPIIINAVSAQPIVLAPQVSSGQKLTILQGPITIVGTQLVPATNSILGGIIVGSNLSITNNGVLSANIPPQGVTAFNGRTGNVTLTANDVTTVANGIYQANGSYLNDVLTNVTTSYGTDSVRGMQKSYGGPNFVAGKLFAGSVGMVGMVSGNETAGVEFMTGGVFNSIRIRQFAHTVILRNSGFEVETGTSNWSWSDNSILTQGRGDTRYQANGSYLNDLNTTVPTSYGNDTLRGMRKASAGAVSNFVAGPLQSGSFGMVGMVFGNEVSGVEFNLGDVFATTRIRQYKHTLLIADDGISVETGTSNWTWSTNHVLTQGRGDARYQPVGSYLTSANLTWSNITGKPTFATVATSGSYTDLANTPNLSLSLTTANAASTYLPSANFTYANITGKPTLATVATSGNYNDLSNKPASYTLPAATNSTLGGIIVGSGLAVANGVLSSTTVNIDGGSASSTGTGSYDGGSATTN